MTFFLFKCLLILVESNDQLYLGDKEYRVELSEYCSQLLNELLNDIQQLGKDHQYRQQVQLVSTHFCVYRIVFIGKRQIFRPRCAWICFLC